MPGYLMGEFNGGCPAADGPRDSRCWQQSSRRLTPALSGDRKIPDSRMSSAGPTKTKVVGRRLVREVSRRWILELRSLARPVPWLTRRKRHDWMAGYGLLLAQVLCEPLKIEAGCSQQRGSGASNLRDDRVHPWRL